MGSLTLLAQARAAGLSVAADGDRLIIKGPRRAGPIAHELMGHKAEVLALLEASPTKKTNAHAVFRGGVPPIST